MSLRMPGLAGAERAIEDLPRYTLVGAEPPIQVAPRLADRLGVRRILLKRDDLIGVAFGGNKVRGLEFLMGEAAALRSDVLVTGAGPQSNHVRATAIVGRMLGIEVVAVLWGQAPRTSLGNLYLTERTGARIVWTGSDDRSSVEQGIEAIAAELRRRGRRPYVIPRGGASPLATVAHFRAAGRVADELRAMGVGVDRVVLAAGSGATAAGWLLWRTAAASTWSVAAYSVSRPTEEVERQILALAESAAARIGLDVDEVDLRVGFSVGDAVGPGYGIPSPAGNTAFELLLAAEGIPLDPTYTAKALAGWLETLRTGATRPDEAILFIHTGGLPAIFAASGTEHEMTADDDVRNNDPI